MKKLFTIDDFMVALIAALGYGYGETIAQLFGLPAPMCLVACIALGIVLEEIISKIVFSKTVQKSTTNRVVAYVAILLIFWAAQYVSARWMNMSMAEYVEEEFLFVVGLPIVGFVINLLIRWVRVRKIRKLYGDGSEGFSSDMIQQDIEELKGQNQPIREEQDADCTVKTRTGTYVGKRDGDVEYYLGIPYAKAPVGELRWKAPEPLPPSDVVMEAKNFGASAIQVEHRGSISEHDRQDEDCLFLNICVGSEKTEKKRPVLVLFHHGNFCYGGSADPLLYGNNYVRSFPDVVFVSFNYRLGIFGFLDFSEVPGGEEYPDSANLGLLDQIAALQWVKENIAAFGGDPERITVAGFESGATSICMLAASKQEQGLFAKAFVFNGNLEAAYDTAERPRALAKELLRVTRTSTVEELSQLAQETLKEASQRLWRNRYICAPIFDGRLIPADPHRAYQESVAADIEFIVGIPSNESRVYRSFVGDQSYEDLIDLAVADIQRRLDERLAAAAQEYIEEQAASSSELEAKAKLVDQWISLCAYRCAVKLAKGGGKVHLMHWSQEPLIKNLGSGTVDALATLFDNRDALEMYGSVVDENLSVVLQTLLHKYVNGDALQLYRNEVHGVDALDWEPFPKALVVSGDTCRCDLIEDGLSEIEGLVDHAMR